jgi:hypothetical protein
MVFSWYSGFLHQWNWPPRYNWNIVESGVKHHKPSLILNLIDNIHCIYSLRHKSCHLYYILGLWAQTSTLSEMVHPASSWLKWPLKNVYVFNRVHIIPYIIIIFLLLLLHIQLVIILCIFCTVTPCSSAPCQNYGRCIDVDGNYVCVCPHGFNGSECQGN